MKTRNRIFIIAEAGVNHNGSVKAARKMIDAAADALCDAVKFQTFKADELATPDAPKALYQRKTTGARGTQYDMLKRLELDEAGHKELIAHCKARKIEFISSPFDLKSIDMLKSLRLNIYKIPSGEITNLPYLRHIGRLRKRVILSTGMSDLSEVREAVRVLVGSGTRRSLITLLHCTTEYPARYEDVNLRAMETMGRGLNMAVGYSDHTPGIEVALAAAALGAGVIEKHFTLDRTQYGPDHAASIEPRELAAMVRAIRNIEISLGSESKKAAEAEIQNRRIIRKSLYAAQDIIKGERFTEYNVIAKRPAMGVSPMKWDSIMGRRAKRSLKKDEKISL